jgi:hypothetical protein
MEKKKKTEQEIIYMRLPDTSRYMIAVNGAYSVQTIPAGSNASKPRGYGIFCSTDPRKLAMCTRTHKLVVKKMYKQKTAAIEAMNKLAIANSKFKVSLIVF